MGIIKKGVAGAAVIGAAVLVTQCGGDDSTSKEGQEKEGTSQDQTKGTTTEQAGENITASDSKTVVTSAPANIPQMTIVLSGNNCQIVDTVTREPIGAIQLGSEYKLSAEGGIAALVGSDSENAWRDSYTTEVVDSTPIQVRLPRNADEVAVACVSKADLDALTRNESIADTGKDTLPVVSVNIDGTMTLNNGGQYNPAAYKDSNLSDHMTDLGIGR